MAPNILVVDDSEYSRILLKQQLGKLGHDVQLANDGVEAWQILQQEPVNILITDWVMPNMDGLTLCRKVRESNLGRYVYIILLTVKGEKNDMVAGIDAGADNFIVKPCSLAELRVMFHTALRVLSYERTLIDRNIKLAKAHEELKAGLRSAGTFHKTLLPAESAVIDGIRFQSLSLPCEYTTGDMFDYYRLDDQHLVFYLLDVAGHGIPAAMLSFTLSHFLSHPVASDETNTLLDFGNPAQVTIGLNRRFQARGDEGLSFTMVYGLIDLLNKKVTFTQAGHPPPILQVSGQPAQPIGDGGFPIGFFEDADYDEYSFCYNEGDRLFVYSDGVTECSNADKKHFSQRRLMACLDHGRGLSLEQTLELVRHNVAKWHGSPSFRDDFSLLGIQF